VEGGGGLLVHKLFKTPLETDRQRPEKHSARGRPCPDGPHCRTQNNGKRVCEEARDELEEQPKGGEEREQKLEQDRMGDRDREKVFLGCFSISFVFQKFCTHHRSFHQKYLEGTLPLIETLAVRLSSANGKNGKQCSFEALCLRRRLLLAPSRPLFD
jgi:hypothetical protein